MKNDTICIVMGFVGAVSAGVIGVPRARADVAAAKVHLLKGDYKLALAEYKRSAKGAERGEGILGQAVAHRRMGQYVKAAKWASKALRVRSVRGAAAVVYAKALMDVGRYTKARKVLEREVKRDSTNYGARALLGRVYRNLGLYLRAKVIWKDLFRDWDNGTLDKKRADHTYYVGIAGQFTKNMKFASDAYQEAVKLAPKLYEANIIWGYLFMEKFNVPEAQKCFQDVLKYDPNHAEAWAGWAWVEWNAARPKKAKGKKHAEQALKVNPNLVEAMLYLASMAIYDKEYGRATILVQRALKVNPNHLRALAHLGTIHFLRDKKADFAKVEARLKKINSAFGDFYTIIAKFADRHHRYPEAVALLKKAKAMDAKDSKALSALGAALLRVGEEGDGLFWLKEAWKLDRFNHQTMNLLNLYDALKKNYTTIKVGHFRIKVAKDEAKIIGRYIPPIVTAALKRYMKKYRWKPPKPITLELYDKSADFGVRTFGEPSHGGILGVCFGPVITALSPSLGRANWAMVLTHELAHTVHIHMSRGRVPRWFTEGLAEYETIILRPEWQREHNLDTYRSIKMGQLKGVTEINRAFTHSKTQKGVVIAYFQSSQLIRFIAGKWGYKALNRALRMYGKNKTTSQVIPAVTGLTVDAFDRAFKVWMLAQLKYYDKNFDPYAATVVDLETLKKRAKRAAKSARAQANLAVGYMMHRQMAKMKAAIAGALKLDSKDPVALYLQATLHMRAGKRKLAQKAYLALIKNRHDGYWVRMQLARFAKGDKKYKAALAHLEMAHRLDPERTKPLDLRVRLLAKLKRKLGVVLELGRLAKLREGSARLMYSIVKRATELRRWDIVRKYGRQGVETQPMNLAIHEKYAWALKVAKIKKSYKAAIFEFQSALVLIPDAMPPARRKWMKKKEAWIYLGMAECWTALRDPDRALRAVITALSRNPNLKRAIALRKKLDPKYRPGG